MAQDTAALMDLLSLERADVLGISMGGRIALELALYCPGRVGRLVAGQHLGSRAGKGHRVLADAAAAAAEMGRAAARHWMMW